jgi:hypothetical protein
VSIEDYLESSCNHITAAKNEKPPPPSPTHDPPTFFFTSDDHAMTGFGNNVPNFSILAMQYILTNMPQNSDGTWQRHKWTVSVFQQMTVPCSKFSHFLN